MHLIHRRTTWRCTLPPMAGIHERYERLLETGLTLAAELSLPAALQRIVELAAELTGARYGALGVLDRDGTISEFITTGVTQEQRAAIGHIPVGRGILGVLIDDARPLRLHDIAEDPRSVGFPPNHPPMRSFLGAPVTARGRVYGNLYLTEKEGGADFGADDERVLVLLAAQAGVAIENAYLYEETQDRARRLEAVRTITTAILGGTDTQELLILVVRHARELAGADLATLALPASTGQLAVEAADGLLADQLRGTVFPAEGSVTGEVIRTGKAVVLADASADERVVQPIVRAGGGPAVFIPLAVRGNILGSLTVANRRGGPLLREAAIPLLELFAEQAAVAIEYGRLQRELQRLALLEDRERIAKELHDGAIQALFAVGMGLQGSAVLASSEELRGRLQDAVEEVDRVIRDLRNYIFGLRPGILADRQLDQALQHLCEEFQERTGVVAIAEVDPQVAAELASQAGDVVQLAREALSNVSRHAEAATCRVSLYRDTDGDVLEVDDDGRGFDPARATGAGQGLRNLRERAEGLGGRAQISSTPGQGTRVRVVLPR
jgi:signal transduction histidine kinase